MLKAIRIPALFVIVFLSLLSCNSHVSTSSKTADKDQVETEDREDGIKEEEEREFKMTQDPALGTIPRERLEAAKQTAERLLNTNQHRGAALTWEERGPSNIGGRTRALLVDKNDITGNTVFAGSVGGGIWKCTNFKSSNYTWTKVNDNMENLAVTSLAQDPTLPNIMYAGTGEGFGNSDAIRGGGIFKSIDGGNTWTVLPATVPSWTTPTNYNFGYVQDVIVTPTAVFAASKYTRYCNYGGVFKSTDGGLTWTRVIGAYSTSSTCIGAGNDLELAANGDLYVSTGLSGSSTNTYGYIFKSPASLGLLQGNAGQWTEVTPTPPTGEANFRRIEVACAPSNANTVFAVCQRYNNNDVTRLYRSTDGGANWTPIAPPSWCDQGTTSSDFTRGQAWYDLIAAYDPNNENRLLMGGVDVMASSNGGTSFSQLTRWSTAGCSSVPYVHADIHNIQFINGSSNDIIVGCDGGVFYSTDGGVSFFSRDNGYNVTQYYGLAMHPDAGSNYILAGAQDNGSHRFNTAGTNAITKVYGGDGALCFIDQTDPTYQVVSTPYCNYHISRNSGVSFGNNVSDGSGDFVNPADYDNVNGYLYCGYDAGTYGKLNVRTGTPAITSIGCSLMSGQYVSAVKSDPNVSGRVYIAAYSGSPKIIRVDNAHTSGPTFTNVSIAGLLSNSYISSIDVEKGNQNHLLVTLSNYGVTSVYESTDGGAGWTDIEGNLPDMPVRWGLFLPANGRIALATELGVWTTSTPAGTTPVWLPDNIGLANVRVDMLRLRTSDNTLGAATHGRGVFTSNLNLIPVTLMGLNGAIRNEHASLEWKTASESNSSHFDVERSYDGSTYRKVGTVSAAGNSNDLRSYAFSDRDKAAEVNYYRLKMVDRDASYKYSNVVKLKNSAAQQSMSIVNPFSNNLEVRFIKLITGKVVIQVADLSGKIVKTATVTCASQSIIKLSTQQEALHKGTYIVTATVDGEKFTKQVIKE